jgi:hypothetical protein
LREDVASLGGGEEMRRDDSLRVEGTGHDRGAALPDS